MTFQQRKGRLEAIYKALANMALDGNESLVQEEALPNEIDSIRDAFATIPPKDKGLDPTAIEIEVMDKIKGLCFMEVCFR
jgi:hypothetical protein